VTSRAKSVDDEIDDVALENNLGVVVVDAERSADAEGGFERAQERFPRVGVSGKGASDDGDCFTASTGARGGYANGKTKLVGSVGGVAAALRRRLLGAGFGPLRFGSRGRKRRLQTGETRKGVVRLVQSPRRVVVGVDTDAKCASIFAIAPLTASIASRRPHEAALTTFFTTHSNSLSNKMRGVHIRRLPRRNRCCSHRRRHHPPRRHVSSSSSSSFVTASTNVHESTSGGKNVDSTVRVAKRHITRRSRARARPDAFDDDHGAGGGGESEMGTSGVVAVDDDGEKGDDDDENDGESDDQGGSRVEASDASRRRGHRDDGTTRRGDARETLRG
jgi:hypothetical protein